LTGWDKVLETKAMGLSFYESMDPIAWSDASVVNTNSSLKVGFFNITSFDIRVFFKLMKCCMALTFR